VKAYQIFTMGVYEVSWKAEKVYLRKEKAEEDLSELIPENYKVIIKEIEIVE